MAPTVRPTETRTWSKRRNALALLLLLLVLAGTQGRRLTKVGRTGIIAGTSTSTGSQGVGRRPDEPPPEAEPEVQAAGDVPVPISEPPDPLVGLPAAPPAPEPVLLPASVDPLGTTRARQRARLVGRPGGPVGPPDDPETNTQDPLVDTGLDP